MTNSIDKGIDDGFRVYADFTGLHAQADADRLARLSWMGDQSFQHTVDIGEASAPTERAAIGLSGFAKAGKTEAANYIERVYGFQRRHIAEPLRDMLRSLLRGYDYSEDMIDRFLTGDLKEEEVPELGVTSRQLQITLGTEWGRELVSPDIWADLWAFQARGSGKVMNDSVRFPNEEEAIQCQGDGFTVLIERPDTGPAAFKWGWVGKKLYQWFGLMWGVHPSERVDLLEPDWVISNDGTLEELYREIDRLMKIEQISKLPTA